MAAAAAAAATAVPAAVCEGSERRRRPAGAHDRRRAGGRATGGLRSGSATWRSQGSSLSKAIASDPYLSEGFRYGGRESRSHARRHSRCAHELHEARAAAHPRVLAAGAAPARGAPCERPRRVFHRQDSAAGARRPLVSAADAHTPTRRRQQQLPDSQRAAHTDRPRPAARVQRRYATVESCSSSDCLSYARLPPAGSPHAQPIKKHELRAEIERLQVR